MGKKSLRPNWLKIGEKFQITPDQCQGSYNTTLSGQRFQKGWESTLTGGEKGKTEERHSVYMEKGYENQRLTCREKCIKRGGN